MQRLSRLPGLQRLSRLSALRKWQDDADLKATGTQKLSTFGVLCLAYASIGIIYGDIGTSPLYVYSTVFQAPPSPEDVLCAASLVFWSITLIVLVKYVCIVMLADDNGEGGTFALYATICRACGIPAINAQHLPSDTEILHYNRLGPGDSSCVHAGSSATAAAEEPHLPVTGIPEGTAAAATATHHRSPKPAIRQPRSSVAGAWLRNQLGHSKTAQMLLLGITLVMTSMVLADGVLTPSISVLSAVQGLQVKANMSQDAVIGITCAILIALFAIQYRGTQDIGVLFAPVILLWFLSNVLVAIYNMAIYQHGAIFRALSPHYIVIWFQNHGREGWERLAGIFLCLTGCEAMFADMGHFTRNAVKISFGAVAYPSLIITYLGQASWLMHNPDGYAAVFYNSVPQTVFWPVFVISVAAAVVASQALISGAFSIVSQSIALGCFPRLQIKHTSKKVGGQIYISEVNYLLLVLCIAVVAGFRSGTAIGNAYGIAVNMVMLTTIGLVSIVMLVAWIIPIYWMLLFFIPFAIVEGAFFTANLLKIPEGGWFSVCVAAGLSLFSVVWIWGSAQKAAAVNKDHFRLSDVLTLKPPGSKASEVTPSLATQSWQLYRRSSMTPVPRNPGMALVYSESPFQVPAVYRQIVQSWGLHSLVVFVTVRQVPIPHVSPQQRLLLAPLEFRGFFRCVARYGYVDVIDQGEAFVQSILDKIAESMPDTMLRPAGLLPPAQATPTAAAAAGAGVTSPALDKSSPKELQSASCESKDTRSATNISTQIASAAGAAANAPTSAAAAAGGTVVITITSDQTPISKLAADAVYVLHRPMVRAKSGSRWLRAFVLEKLYAGLWICTSRSWQSWKLPGARLFEVGLVMEL